MYARKEREGRYKQRRQSGVEKDRKKVKTRRSVGSASIVIVL